MVTLEGEVSKEALARKVSEDTQVLREIIIDSPESYTKVAELAIFFQSGIKAVEEKYAKAKKSAHASWKEICALENEFKGKYETALLEAKTMMAAWDESEERRRKLQEATIASEDKNRREDEAMDLAMRLEASGDVLGASQVIEDIIASPGIPVTIVKQVPKVNGIGSGRTYWEWEPVDESKIPEAYWVLDREAIQSVVDANKQNAEKLIPGIKVKPRKGLPSVKARG